MLNIINKTKYDDLKPYYGDIYKYYHKALDILKLKDQYDISLIIVGPRKIKELNNDYRNINKETDVLSFALVDDKKELKKVYELGDIFINRNRVLSQAKEYKHSIKREFIFLFIHGLLHLCTYDHMNKKYEKKMFAMQDRIIGNLK